MPVMGFDDERVRDGYRAAEEKRRVVWDFQATLREYLAEIERRDAERVAAWLRLRQAMEELAAAVVEAFRPLMDALVAVGEAALRAMEDVWRLVGDGEREAGQYRGPVHYNCRCLPVERVDPVKAGRTRWWTRK